MNRDFEFKQLLRAYRSGIISEATFEEEMHQIEGNGATRVTNGNGAGGFAAFGKTYKSERAAIVSFLDKVRAGEANGGEAFAAWASVCKTDCIKTGIRMIAEREAYHARIFEQRLLELGGEKRAMSTEEGRKFKEYLGNAEIPDTDKLLRFVKSVGDPKEAIKPICDFAALIKEDMGTKEALRLFAEDELSSTTWVRDSCAALNPHAHQTSETAKAEHSQM
jgi:hypothetical protein